MSISNDDRQNGDQPTERKPMWEENSPVEDVLIPEHRALQLLDPIDQYYSPNVNLQGIRSIFIFIIQASRNFSKKLRTHLPTKTEIVEFLEKDGEKHGDIESILDYLVHGSESSQAFVKKHYGVVLENKKPVLRPLYIGGIEDVHKTILLSDRLSADTIHELTAGSLPWRDKESYIEFLAEQVKADNMKKTYVSGLFDISPVNDSIKYEKEELTEGAEVYEKSILPNLYQEEDFLYVEIPHVFETDHEKMEQIFLIRDNEDIFTRYEYFSKLLMQIAQKAYQTNQDKENKKELVRDLFEAIEEDRAGSTPTTLKKLAEKVINIYSRPDRYRQIALEIFLLKEHVELIKQWKQEALEAERKKYLDLLLQRIHSRQWLLFFPASFYPRSTFEEALAQSGIMGIRKSGAELGIATHEDYYCILETGNLNTLLERANIFELSIIEEILAEKGLSTKEIYSKKVYQRKKNLLFLIMNPIIYFLRSFFGLRKKFIENNFAVEKEKRGPAYNSSLRDSFAASGLRATPASAARDEDEIDPGEDPEKAKLKHVVLNYIFPDPAPSAKNINENDYKSRIRQAARSLRDNPEFDHYYQKSEDSIIADIEALIKPELIEDVYSGSLPSGKDAKGNPFTRKTYAPKDIKDQPIIYNMIREELEHESAYGTKEVVEYYKAKSRIYSEGNMSRIREEEKLRREAERKQRIAQAKKEETRAKPENKKKKVEKTEPAKPDAPEKKPDTKEQKAAREKLSKVASKIAKEIGDRYTGPRNFSAGNLFPMTSGELEKKMGLKEGNLSVYASKNSSLFSEHFVSFKAGTTSYYFPRKFFLSNKNQIASFYDELVKHEEKHTLPNGEILAKAHDIATAIKLKKL